MATKVFMEALSPTMEEGRLVKWHKQEGDAVKAGETLAEVETDKAVMDLVARADGVLRQVAVAEGQTVPVGSVVAVIAAPGEAVGQTAQAAAPTPAGRGEGGRAMPEPARSPTPAPTAVAVPADATRVKASPLAKRIAKDSGVDLKLVTGSGPGGRVVKRDLEEAGRRERGEVRRAAAQPVVPPEAPLLSPISSAVRGGAAFEDVPLTQIRKTIAKRLATSLGPIPHFFLTTEVAMERAAEAREDLNKQLGDRGKVSLNVIVINAHALALGSQLVWQSLCNGYDIPTCNADMLGS